MDYRNGTAVDTFGCKYVRTLNSIEPERLAQSYLRLLHAYRPAESMSSRNVAIDAKAKVVGCALAGSLC